MPGTTFPFTTPVPKAEVVLPIGTHILELVVEDTAGLRSDPDTVVIEVVRQVLPGPTIDAIRPASARQGQKLQARITGQGLAGAAQVTFPAQSGVSCEVLAGGSDTFVDVELTIGMFGTVGGYRFLVQNSAGATVDSGEVSFTVEPASASPAITSINPASGRQGTSGLAVEIGGAYLDTASGVTFSGDGVSARITVWGPWCLMLSLDIAPTASEGPRSFKIASSGGVIESPADVVFTVLRAKPVMISGIDPSEGVAGSALQATITGRGLADPTAVIFPGKSITNAILHRGEVIHRLAGHGGTCLNSVVFSRGGDLALTGGEDCTVRVWDATRGAEIRRFNEQSAVTMASFSPDGDMVVAGTRNRDGSIRLWDVRSGQLIRVLQGRAGEASWARFSPDGRLIVTAGSLHGIHVWETSTGKLINLWECLPTHLAFNPVGTRLAAGGYDDCRIYDVQTGRLIRKLTGVSPQVMWVVFSSNGQRVLTAGSDAVARLWNAETGELLHNLTGHGATLRMAAFSPDDKTIATVSDDKTARLWEAESGRQLHVLEGHREIIWALAFSPDGSTVATVGNDATARVWDVQTGTLSFGPLIHQIGGQARVDFSPDGSLILTACGTDAVLWGTVGGDDTHLSIHMAVAEDAEPGNRTFWVETPRGVADSTDANVTFEVKGRGSRINDRSVSEVTGIGPALTQRLAEQDIHLLAELAAMQPSDLAGVLRVSEERASKFIDEAKRRLAE